MTRDMKAAATAHVTSVATCTSASTSQSTAQARFVRVKHDSVDSHYKILVLTCRTSVIEGTWTCRS